MAHSSILYLTPGEHLIKVHQHGRWVTQPEAPPDTRWYIITNLIDESFSLINVPPMGRSDRRSFLQAQLDNQFQGMTFRAILPYTSPVNKNRFVITGVGDIGIKQAIQSLADTDATIVGVWSLPTLLMNGLISQRRSLPATLLAMLPTPEGIRLLFVSGWQPTLTRLLSPDLDPEQLGQEVLMTRRYLENSKSIERQATLPLVVIGPSPSWVQSLELHQFKLLKTHWGGGSAAEVMNTLLDMVLAKPAGQVAGLVLRKHHVALQVRYILIAATAAFFTLGLLAFAMLVESSLGKHRLLDQAQAEVGQLRAKHQGASQRLAEITEQEALLLTTKRLYEVDLGWPDLVPSGLRRLSQVLHDKPEVILQRLEWRYTEFGQACPALLPEATTQTITQATIAMDSTTTVPKTPPLTADSGPRRVVLEMRVGFTVPTLVSPLMAARQKEALTQSLQKEGGLEVQVMSKSGSDEGSLVGGGWLVNKQGAVTQGLQIQGKGTDLSYCLSFSGSGN